MIPRTFPSNGEGAMIVAEVNPSGLRKWVDYIPVEDVTDGSGGNGRYNDLGGKAIEILADTTGLTAWRDYIPVVTTTGTNWRSDDAGVIPVFEGAEWSRDYSEAVASENPGELAVMVVGEDTSTDIQGFVSYLEAVNGIPGSPFGSLTPDDFDSVVVREISFTVVGSDLVVTIIGLGTEVPAWTSVNFEGWQTLETAEAVSSTGSFDDEDIFQFIWTLVGQDELPFAVPSTIDVVVT